MSEFLSSGVGVNQQGLCGETILMSAADCGQEALVSFLLKNGAEPGIENNDGQTALSYAKKHNHENIISMLSLYSNDYSSRLIDLVCDKSYSYRKARL